MTSPACKNGKEILCCSCSILINCHLTRAKVCCQMLWMWSQVSGLVELWPTSRLQVCSLKLFLQWDIMNLYHSEQEFSQTVLKFKVPQKSFILPWLKSVAKYLQFNCYIFTWYLIVWTLHLYAKKVIISDQINFKTNLPSTECKKVFRIIVSWSCCDYELP